MFRTWKLISEGLKSCYFHNRCNNVSKQAVFRFNISIGDRTYPNLTIIPVITTVLKTKENTVLRKITAVTSDKLR